MTGQLQGKTALITGGGRGIGRALALKFAGAGARVVVNDLDSEPADAVVEEIRAGGGQATACAGNVTAPDFAERFIGTAVREYQGIDIIVNNAGYTWDNVIQKMTDEQWYAIIDCHLTAPFRILRAAYPVLRAQFNQDAAAGRRTVRKVVNISSVSGLHGIAGQVNYSSAKAGIQGLTRALAREWGRIGVTVNAVAFGYIKTRLTGSLTEGATANIEGRAIRVGVNPAMLAQLEHTIPMGHGGSPEEGAAAVYLLCLPESDYVSGQTLVCSGGSVVN